MATLFDYYKSQGQSLPSISERAKQFETLGLGSANQYTGSADQNVRLLSSLGGGAAPAPATVNRTITSTGSTSSAGSTGDFGSYLNQALSQYGSVYDPIKQEYEDYGNKLSGLYAGQKKELEAAVPLIQQRYSNLIKELEAKDLETQGDIKEEGEAAIGETQARAGARGMFSSGVEIGQEAKIGQDVAKLIKSQAEGTARRKGEATTAQGTEENQIRQMIANLAMSEGEAGFKIKEAIARLGPEKFDSAIKLAAQYTSEQRATEEMQMKRQELAMKYAASGKSEKSLAALKADIASGKGVKEIYAKYGGDVDPDLIYSVYNANSPHGPAKESERELGKYGVTIAKGTDWEATTASTSEIKNGQWGSTRDEVMKTLESNKQRLIEQGEDLGAIQAEIETKYPVSSGGGSWNFLDMLGIPKTPETTSKLSYLPYSFATKKK